MTVSRALRRLLGIRELEEEQSRQELEAALGELNRLQNALAVTADRDRRGRRLVLTSAQTGELPDRLAGLEETRGAARLAKALSFRRKAVEVEAAGLRQKYLAKRVERRQAEALIEAAEARDAVETKRRAQQALDDWYSARRLRAGVARHPKEISGMESDTVREDGATASET